MFLTGGEKKENKSLALASSWNQPYDMISILSSLYGQGEVRRQWRLHLCLAPSLTYSSSLGPLLLR